ncbi:MAG: hypothetical protein ACFE85_03130 [Candidatus Hodarchaeota archaeon]
MVNFLTLIYFPGEKAEEIGKILPKLPKLPDYVKPPQIYATVSNDNGLIKAYGIYEVDDDKSHEGYVAIAKRLTGYFEVEGVHYKIEPLMTLREALAIIGLA